jgi:hypothetical protein
MRRAMHWIENPRKEPEIPPIFSAFLGRRERRCQFYSTRTLRLFYLAKEYGVGAVPTLSDEDGEYFFRLGGLTRAFCDYLAAVESKALQSSAEERKLSKYAEVLLRDPVEALCFNEVGRFIGDIEKMIISLSDYRDRKTPQELGNPFRQGEADGTRKTE